jgi:hypothetical protein
VLHITNTQPSFNGTLNGKINTNADDPDLGLTFYFDANPDPDGDPILKLSQHSLVNY